MLPFCNGKEKKTEKKYHSEISNCANIIRINIQETDTLDHPHKTEKNAPPDALTLHIYISPAFILEKGSFLRPPKVKAFDFSPI